MNTPAQRLDAQMEPYAVMNDVPPEQQRKHPLYLKPDNERTRFAIDYGRIAHSAPFRQLEKAQVFAHGTPGSYTPSTRWSHTMEVQALARETARALGVNEDLAATIGLAHDLGHPPFGHEGEEALDQWMKKHGLAFDHNRQTVRLVTLLAYHSRQYRGLNLCLETVDGLGKHDPHGEQGQGPVPKFGIEAQIADASDTASWTARDVHDGIKMGILDPDKLRGLSLYAEAEELTLPDCTEIRSAIMALLTRDLIRTTRANIAAVNPRTAEDVYRHTEKLVRQSPDMELQRKKLTKYMYAQMYRPAGKQPFVDATRAVIHALCDHYLQHPTGEVLLYEDLADANGDTKPRVTAVKDVVSGLSDAQARTYAERDLGMSPDIVAKTAAMFRP